MLASNMLLMLMLVLVLLVTGGCTSVQDEFSRQLLDELLSSRLDVMMWAAVWRSVVFGVLGLLLGLGVFFGLRSRALLRLNWTHAKWVRGIAGALIVLAGSGAGAWWGFWTGSMRGAESVIRDGQFGTELLPVAGDAGSLLVAAVYVGSELSDGDAVPSDTEVAARVASYAKGEWSMPIEQLEQRLAKVRAQVVGIAADVAKREVYARYPALEGTLADKLIPWALDKLSATLTEKAVESASGNEMAAMVVKPAQEVMSTLDDAAEREGEPELLAHAELSAHVVEVGLLPMIMGPIEHFAGGQRKLGPLGFVLLVLLIVGGIRLADYVIARRAAKPALL